MSEKHKQKNLWILDTEKLDIEKEIHWYSTILPKQLDLILLSVGEDGHVASIFPHCNSFSSEVNTYYVSNAPKHPSKRFTITPKVILDAKNLIVMAVGTQKGEILAKCFENPSNVKELPVRLTIGRTWVLDKQAYKAFKERTTFDLLKTKIIHE